jgi:hypothetical protein
LFLGFQTQRVPTDAAGNAAAGSTTIGQLISGGPAGPTGPTGPTPTPTPAAGTVYVAHALINPTGADPGSEVIVLASLSTATQTLTNWRLLDKNGRVTRINATLAAGSFVAIALDGSGVQLGNNGGNLILQDQTNAQVDAVTYTGETHHPTIVTFASGADPTRILPGRAHTTYTGMMGAIAQFMATDHRRLEALLIRATAVTGHC